MDRGWVVVYVGLVPDKVDMAVYCPHKPSFGSHYTRCTMHKARNSLDEIKRQV